MGPALITAFRLCGGPPKLRAAEWSRGSLLPRRVPMAFIKFSFSFSVSIHLKYRVNRWISRAPLGVKAYYYLYPPPNVLLGLCPIGFLPSWCPCWVVGLNGGCHQGWHWWFMGQRAFGLDPPCPKDTRVHRCFTPITLSPPRNVVRIP